MELKIDYPPDFAPRYGYGKPGAKHITQLLDKNAPAVRAFLEAFRDIADLVNNIPFHPTEDKQLPFWLNGWIPMLDAMSICSVLRSRNPALMIEIGSGNSTKFARHAIQHYSLRTKILSIDPAPRADIAGIADEIVCCPLEAIDLNVFDDLSESDFIFFDGSHRCFQNSDVSVFFIDILPQISKGVMIGVHDIFWPHDYPPAWKARLYSEQYVLGAYLLGAGDRVRIHFGGIYAAKTMLPELHAVFPPDVLSRWLQEQKFVASGGFFFEKL